MNVKDLEFYQLVCEQKSITKAARLLYMTPQGLSKIMKNIETELEVTLLNRTAAGITLTTAGQYLFEKLPDFLASYDMIRSEIPESLISMLHLWKILRSNCLSINHIRLPKGSLSLFRI